MTDDPRAEQSVEGRLRELQHLLDEGLITAEEHDGQARRIRGEVAGGSSRAELMHGNAVELLDTLIGKRLRWDENERFYLDELAPSIVRSDDPEFAWMPDEEERVLVTRLKALMSDDEWHVLPELIQARRSLTLHELESDRGRPERLAEQEQARRADEIDRRLEAAWAAAQERAHRDGAARIQREEAAESARRDEEMDARAERAEPGPEAGASQGDPVSEGTQTAFDDLPQGEQPAPGRRRRQRRRGHQPPAAAGASEGGTARPSSEAPQGASTGEESSAAATGARLPESEPARVEIIGSTDESAENPSVPPDADPSATESGKAPESEGSGRSEVSPEQSDERMEPDVSDEAPPPETGSDTDPDADDPTADPSVEPVSAESDGEPELAGSSEDPDGLPTSLDHSDTGSPEASGGDSVATQAQEEARGAQLDRTRVGGGPERGSVAADLAAYAARLERRRERPLADAVSAYADRVDAVERGELPPSMSVPPTAIAPEMVGAAISWSRTDAWIEVVRNALIFVPVLWTWLKLQSAVEAYSRTDRSEQFFHFWVETGGAGWFGGTLAQAAREVAYVLILLILVNVFLGWWRRHTAARGARIGRRFAAVMASAEAAGVASRSADPQAALDGFVFASNELTANLRSVGTSLEASVTPLADSARVAQQAFREMSGAVARQERQLTELVERLGRVAEIGDQLGALRRDFASAQEAAARSAEALAGIRDSLDPSARDFASAAVTLDQLAEQLARMTEAMAGAIADLESGLGSSAGHLREAATSMNAVATRVLDDLDGRGDGRGDGR